MHAAMWRRVSGAALAIAVLSSWGCDRSNPGADTIAINHRGPVPPVRNGSNAAIIADAESLYAYGPERPQLKVRDAAFPGPYVSTEESLPRMWIATATLKDSTHRPPERILARIRSEHAYPKAGIDSGYNY